MGKYCPPCCKSCAFKAEPADLDRSKITQVVMPADAYGCKLPGGSEIIIADGVLGALRQDGFHSITENGSAFHAAQGSPLATYR